MSEAEAESDLRSAAHADGTWRRVLVAAAAAASAVVAGAAYSGLSAEILGALSVALLAMLGIAVATHRPRSVMGKGDLVRKDIAGVPEAARALLECLEDPLLVLDGAQRVVFANHAARVLTGAGSEGKHITAVLRTPEVLEAIASVAGGAEAQSVGYSVPVPTPRHYRAYVVRAGAPETALILVQIQDLTAMRRAEEMRADFVANASHELRTPLAAVSGFIDTLRGHAKNDSQARERFLEIMSVEAGRMRRLIEDLLSLTRIELNEHNLPAGEEDVVAMVREASAALAPLADAEGIVIQIAEHAPLFAVGARDELIQVFQNLIHNAIKYGRQSGRVRVSFGESEVGGKRDGGRLVSVAVADEGEGIPRDAIPRLTERFYRVDVRRSRERGGTGLGLAIVKHILNRHHGRLQIESVQGVGSTFTVYLPAAPVRGAVARAS